MSVDCPHIKQTSIVQIIQVLYNSLAALLGLPNSLCNCYNQYTFFYTFMQRLLHHITAII